MSVRLLEPKFFERVWGTESLQPLFPDQSKKIGEVWFDAGPAFPLLIKFLFTAQNLSVQVHPDDAYARAVENARGKTEMWHILKASPESNVALGFCEPQSKEAILEAIHANTIDKLLKWVPVKAGDTFFTEAGTVHAIGAGITLCEIQQNSDVTYRLYDYDRGRPLHLEKGLEVSATVPYEGRREYPITCAQFNVDLLEITESIDRVAECAGALIVLEGSGSFDDVEVRAGQVALITGDRVSIQARPGERLKVLHAGCSSET